MRADFLTIRLSSGVSGNLSYHLSAWVGTFKSRMCHCLMFTRYSSFQMYFTLFVCGLEDNKRFKVMLASVTVLLKIISVVAAFGLDRKVEIICLFWSTADHKPRNYASTRQCRLVWTNQRNLLTQLQTVKYCRGFSPL